MSDAANILDGLALGQRVRVNGDRYKVVANTGAASVVLQDPSGARRRLTLPNPGGALVMRLDDGGDPIPVTDLKI